MVWVPTVFTKNRERLLEGNIAEAFFQGVLAQANTRHLLSHEHFTVDGTLLEAWASHKSVRPIGAPAVRSGDDDDPKNPTEDCRGEKRSDGTHRSVTDPDARLARKSQGAPAILGYLGSVIPENRHRLVVATDVRAPDGHAEEEAALEMVTQLESHAAIARSEPTRDTTPPPSYRALVRPAPQAAPPRARQSRLDLHLPRPPTTSCEFAR